MTFLSWLDMIAATTNPTPEPTAPPISMPLTRPLKPDFGRVGKVTVGGAGPKGGLGKIAGGLAKPAGLLTVECCEPPPASAPIAIPPRDDPSNTAVAFPCPGC